MFAGPAFGHGQGPPLAFYGAEMFGVEAGRCQRMIARAAHRCFAPLARSRLQCAAADLLGAGCDLTALAAKEAFLRERLRRLIVRGCTADQVFLLGFLSLEELEADLLGACEQEAAATTSLIFGPAMVAGRLESGPAARDACLLSAAHGTFKVARAALQERGRALGRIAGSVMDVPTKLAAMAAADGEVGRLRRVAAAALEQACGAEFGTAYGVSTDSFLRSVAARGECVAAAAFVVEAVTCPAPVCGNRVLEPTEECDDGNLAADDACDAACRVRRRE
ncbi:hypothetical protein L6Q96_14200 [Candidatus Binatia bacterium]|nr:hypothetical protein [Candidatus Binatia bacterium]